MFKRNSVLRIKNMKNAQKKLPDDLPLLLLLYKTN